MFNTHCTPLIFIENTLDLRMSDQRSAQIPSLSLASSIPALFAAVSAGVLLVFTLLRETLIFWQNAGGYPLLLRDLVLYGFYPIILFCLGCIAMAVWRLIFVRRGSS